MSGPLAQHHLFTNPASVGTVTCLACGRRYDLDNGWQALIDPCIDGVSTGLSEAEAKRQWLVSFFDLLGRAIEL